MDPMQPPTGQPQASGQAQQMPDTSMPLQTNSVLPEPNQAADSQLPPLASGPPATQAAPMASNGLAVSPVATDTLSQKKSPHAPDVAEDVDLIEKEWVTKAKAIISSTSNDPHQQNQEMSRFKADYLKTRYSKDLKVSEQ